MRNQLIILLNQYNSKEHGIIIPVSIEDYVDKIMTYSTIVPYIIQGELKAFISYYNNDLLKRHSYLSMILVSRDFQGKGIGKLLLELSIKDLKRSGFFYYSLEVLKTNYIAIDLYSHYDFYKKEDRGEMWLMEKVLTRF